MIIIMIFFYSEQVEDFLSLAIQFSLQLRVGFFCFSFFLSIKCNLVFISLINTFQFYFNFIVLHRSHQHISILFLLYYSSSLSSTSSTSLCFIPLINTFQLCFYFILPHPSHQHISIVFLLHCASSLSSTHFNCIIIALCFIHLSLTHLKYYCIVLHPSRQFQLYRSFLKQEQLYIRNLGKQINT